MGLYWDNSMLPDSRVPKKQGRKEGKGGSNQLVDGNDLCSIPY